jgi:hypothetical protein
MAMKAVELGQLVEKIRDCPAPSATGNESAITQAPLVTARMFPRGAASISLSTA